MGFQQEVKRVEDSSAAMGQRVLALCRCVERYCPIGFQATLEYLETKVGPYREDEEALAAAGAMLKHAHSLWQEELRQYAAKRLSEKRAGQRAPRPNDLDPNVLRTWHGRRQDAARFAVSRWRDLAGGSATADERERLLGDLGDCALAARFSQEDQAVLGGLLSEFDASASWEAWEVDPRQYFRARSLGVVASQLQTLVDTRRCCRLSHSAANRLRSCREHRLPPAVVASASTSSGNTGATRAPGIVANCHKRPIIRHQDEPKISTKNSSHHH